MKCKEIMECLERLAPGYYAYKWDNVGLLIGREDKEVGKIMLALDATAQVVRQAVEWEADMLITHHPLIFSGMKSITTGDFTGKRVYDLIRSDIACFAMHTNFDVMGMADAVADELELKKCEVLEIAFKDDIAVEGIGRVGFLPFGMKLEECASYIKSRCKLPAVRVFGDPLQPVERIALVPGAGKSYVSHALEKGAHVLLTGDIGHHDGLDAVEQGLCIIDAGHYGLEKIFSTYMREVLQRELPTVLIKEAVETEPFLTL